MYSSHVEDDINSEMDSILQLLDRIKHLCNHKEYNSLCQCLTIDRLSNHPEFSDWTVSKGRLDCVEQVFILLSPTSPDRHPEKGINLLNLLAKALASESSSDKQEVIPIQLVNEINYVTSFDPQPVPMVKPVTTSSVSEIHIKDPGPSSDKSSNVVHVQSLPPQVEPEENVFNFSLSKPIPAPPSHQSIVIATDKGKPEALAWVVGLDDQDQSKQDKVMPKGLRRKLEQQQVTCKTSAPVVTTSSRPTEQGSVGKVDREDAPDTVSIASQGSKRNDKVRFAPNGNKEVVVEKEVVEYRRQVVHTSTCPLRCVALLDCSDSSVVVAVGILMR